MDDLLATVSRLFALSEGQDVLLRGHLRGRLPVIASLRTVVNALVAEQEKLCRAQGRPFIPLVSEAGTPFISCEICDAVLGRVRGGSVKQYAHQMGVLAGCLSFSDPTDSERVRLKIRSALATGGDPATAIAVSPRPLAGTLSVDMLLGVAEHELERAWLLVARDLAQRGRVTEELEAVDAGVDPNGRPQLRLARTKSTSAPDYVTLGFDTASEIDVARAAISWPPLIWEAFAFQPDGPLLPSILDGRIVPGPMTAKRLKQLIKSLVIRLGQDPTGISLHSMRVGGAQASVAANDDETTLLRVGLWKDLAQALRYARQLSVWAKAPTAVILATPMPEEVVAVIEGLMHRNQALSEKGAYRRCRVL